MESESDNQRDATKKRKMKAYGKSDVFEHENDQKQYRKLFKTIDESVLIQKMDISHGITKEIAEYATGDWTKCKSDHELVSTLWSDNGKYECLACQKTVRWTDCEICGDNWVSSVKINVKHCLSCSTDVCEDCSVQCQSVDCHEGNICCKNCCIHQCNNCQSIYCFECVTYELPAKCAVCGNKTCKNCIGIGHNGCDCELNVKCVCIKCVNANKDLFKYL